MISDSFTIIAHRGASGTEPENTLRAFRHAAKLGCKWIECDVRMTKDSVPVIIHDATVNRTTDGRGSVSRSTYYVLRRLDAGKGEKIPSLKEVLVSATRNQIRLVLEIKDPRALKPTIRLVRAYSHTPPVRANGRSPVPLIISSFFTATLLRAKKLLPSLMTALIIERPSTHWIRAAKRARADMVHIFARLATKEKIARAHDAGLKVWAWTMNTKNEALKLKKIGADGIFTDELRQLISLT